MTARHDPAGTAGAVKDQTPASQPQNAPMIFRFWPLTKWCSGFFMDGEDTIVCARSRWNA